MTDRTDGASAEWKRHWPLVAAATTGFTFSPVVTYSLGLFMEPLAREFQWTRAEISAGLIIFAIVAVPFSAPVGALIDRVGARWVAVPGTLLCMLAIAALSLANGSFIQWMALWTFYAVATLFVKTTVWTAAVSKTFAASRGLALGVVLCGTGLSQTLTPIIAQPLIDSYGWRHAYQFIAAGWGGLALIVLLLFFHDAGGAAKGQQGASAAPPKPATGHSFREAVRSRPILQIFAAVLVGSLINVGVSVHLVPILGETGLSRPRAAAFAGLAGISAIAGKLITGFLLDRVRGNLIPFTSFALPALAMSIFAAKLGTPVASALAVIVLGYSAGASTQSTVYLITRYAGLRSYGAVYGVLSSIIGLAVGFGPWFAGRIFDASGSYQLLLTIAIPCMLVSGLLVIGLGPYPRFDEEPAEREPSPQAAG